MRPTDEDQPGSRRPNLMSSARRSPNEINILDMLDRQSPGRLPRRMLRSFFRRPALFWYGGAGLLVCGIVAALAWVARDGTPAAADTVLAGAIQPVALTPAAVSDTVGNPSLVASDQATTLDLALQAPATVVDAAPAPEPDTPAPAPAPPTQGVGRIDAHEDPREPARPAAQAATLKGVARASHATSRAASHPAPHPAPAAARKGRQAPAKAAAPAVDTDVALISAIIQHANARQEAEESGCPDKACGTRKP